MMRLQCGLFLSLILVFSACGGGSRPKEAAPAPPGADLPKTPVSGPVPAKTMDPPQADMGTPAGKPDSATVTPAPAVPSELIAPPSDKLAAFLKSLQEASQTEAGVNALLETIKLPDGDSTPPDAARAQILELRTKGGLFGALILLCGKDKITCEDDCDVAFSLKQAPGKAGELVTGAVSAEIFSGKKHCVELSPAFADTGALLVHYEIRPRQACAPDEPSEYADVIERALLLKVGDRRIVPYQTFTTGVMNAEPGHNQTVDTTLAWHASETPEIQYLGVTRDTSESFSGTAPDVDNPRSVTCTRSNTVIVMEKGKLWRSVTGKAVEALRQKDAGLVGLPDASKRSLSCE